MSGESPRISAVQRVAPMPSALVKSALHSGLMGRTTSVLTDSAGSSTAGRPIRQRPRELHAGRHAVRPVPPQVRGGKSIWDTDHNDLRAYKNDLRAYKAVRLRQGGPDTIAVATWNRSIAALDKWVQWSLYEGLLTREPFRYIDKTVMTPRGPKRVRVNAEYDTDDWDEPLRIVQFVDYLL